METLEDITQKMKNSGHKDHFMKRIMIQGITKYERKVRKSELDSDDSQYFPLHQPSGRCLKRLKKKAQAQENCLEETKSKENWI
jgi:3-hydroxy-3-methylglutaryl CoA synthase